MKALLAACLITVAAGSASARNDSGCKPEIEDALRRLAPQTAVAGDVVSSDCRVWPSSTGKKTAAVMAFEADRGHSRQHRWVIVLALLDGKYRPLNSLTTVVEEDATTALGEFSLRLDTEPYLVKPGLRALGLRFSSAASQASGAEASWGNELMLFVPDGRQFMPVFGRTMNAQRAEAGSLSVQSPGAVWINAHMTLSVGPATASGWNDLVITETSTRDGNEPAKFDTTPTRQNYVYRHDGKAYKLLARPAPFWDGYCCSIAW